MKKLLFAFLLCFVLTAHAAIPTSTELQTFATRMNFYVGIGQNPNQVAVSMSNYFGKHFEGRYNAGTQTTDIMITYGEGSEMYYMQVIGTMIGS